MVHGVAVDVFVALVDVAIGETSAPATGFRFAGAHLIAARRFHACHARFRHDPFEQPFARASRAANAFIFAGATFASEVEIHPLMAHGGALAGIGILAGDACVAIFIAFACNEIIATFFLHACAALTIEFRAAHRRILLLGRARFLRAGVIGGSGVVGRRLIGGRG